MLTEICAYLKNWFEDKKLYGNFKIADGVLTFADDSELPIKEGQYYRIIGSIFNDGIHEKFSLGSPEPSDESELKDEEFEGSVWVLILRPDFLKLVKEIEAWQAKNGNIDSQAMSPFNSESFGGYSYSKGSGNSASGGNASSWQSIFDNRLKRYRKY